MFKVNENYLKLPEDYLFNDWKENLSISGS